MRNRFLFAGTILWSVAASVVITVLLSIPLFALDSGWEHLPQVAGMSEGRLLMNYHVLMRYLLNPMIGKLKMPDFPDSASALQHFAEVKGMFLFAIAVMVLLALVMVVFLREHVAILVGRGIILVMLVPVVLCGIAALVGFDNFFIAFHKVLFVGQTSWLFDPDTDPIINVLTDQFFMLTFILFGLLYEVFWGVVLLSSRRGYGKANYSS
ncbi:MAG: TIGR01906 family membrane protein [Streptococcaceae bacterium]|nr:TIGR01906 family membrane protein [Streptococcaceae bacterium]